MTLFVGTSGWAYQEWKPDFYPRDVPQSKFLEFYGQTLGACEVNATFYRLQSDETFTRWLSFTPDHFRFSTKAHRRLTHSRNMAPDAEARGFLDLFLKSVGILGPRLGAILFQFPPRRERDDDQLGGLLEALPAGTPYAFEFRHDSWNNPDVQERIAASNATVCLSNTDGAVPDALPPGPIAYVRLRTDRYSEEAREGWRQLLQRESKERPVFAFTKHEGIPAGDPYGGIGLAKWLVDEVANG